MSTVSIRGVRWTMSIVVVALIGAALGGVAAQAPAATGALPDGEGAAFVRSRCLSCHGADLIESQRLTEAGWGRELDKMARWGATVTDGERPAMVAYLSRHFGVASAPPAASAAAPDGQAIFARSCLTCHAADLTEQQRLSPAGWTRELEKMMRWGAQLSEAEKVTLAAYLAARFPVR